jgi:type II secretory pathway component PulM
MVGWKELSYRQKNKWLLGGALGFLLIVYLLAIRGTLEQYEQGGQLQEKLGEAENAPRQIAQLERKLAYWDQLASSLNDSSANVQKALFTNVSRACNSHQVSLRSLEFLSSEEKENHQIDTYQVVIEGAYPALLSAVYELENKLGNGILSSLAFEMEKDRYTKKDYLVAKLYIQSIQ